jgi:hypothetical protein
MTKGLLLALVVSFGLVGCAGLRQFPEGPPENNYKKALDDLDAEYAETVDKIYKATGATAPKDRMDIRNQFIERRIAVIDAYYKEFQAGLVKENVRADFLISLVAVGVGGAGSLVSETASQILSAVSGGLAGGQAAYGKAVLYDKAMSALVAQMQATRKVIKGQIFQRWELDIDKYPLWMARTDLEAYYFAGSLPGAIIATAADAQQKSKEADAILFEPITQEAVTPEAFNSRKDLVAAVDKLDAPRAKALVVSVGATFKGAKSFIDDQYPPDRQKADTTGNGARDLLKQLVTLTAKKPSDLATWQRLMGSL